MATYAVALQSRRVALRQTRIDKANLQTDGPVRHERDFLRRTTIYPEAIRLIEAIDQNIRLPLPIGGCRANTSLAPLLKFFSHPTLSMCGGGNQLSFTTFSWRGQQR